MEIARSEWPEGYELQWIAVRLLGKKVGDDYLATGWRPVLRGDFGGKFAYLADDIEEVSVIHGGLLLVVKPAEEVVKSRQQEKAVAQRPVELVKERLQAGFHHDPSVFLEYAMRAGWTPSVYDPPVKQRKYREWWRNFMAWPRNKLYLLHVRWVEYMLTDEQKRHARIGCVSNRHYAENIIRMHKMRKR